MSDRQLHLLGVPVSAPKPPHPRGYAARPGTGPKGQRCNTCEHCMVVVSLNRRSRKCHLRAKDWTPGAESDVKHNAPACRDWVRKKYSNERPHAD